MIKEALEFLRAQFQLADTPKIQKAPGEPDHCYLLNGNLVEATPHPRSHEAMDLDTIARWANASEESKVWYHRECVYVLLDDETRRDTVKMIISPSDQMKTIASWGQASKQFEQAELLLMLRTMFKGCMPQDLVAILRKVKFSSSSDSERVVSTTKTSIGKKMEAEVSGALEIPDDFLLTVPIFANRTLPMTGTIEVAISINVQQERFVLHPVPGSVEKALADAEAEIGNRLSAMLTSETNLFYGCP